MLLKASWRLAAIALILFFYCNVNQDAYAQMGYIDGELDYSGATRIGTFHVIGKGVEPERAKTRAQAILMAERAAIADGYRQLIEKVHGVYVDSQSHMSNGSVNYSLDQNETQAWLRGAEIVQINRLSNGITEAEMVLRLNFCHQGCCNCNNCRPRKSFWGRPPCSGNSYYEERHSIKTRHY